MISLLFFLINTVNHTDHVSYGWAVYGERYIDRYTGRYSTDTRSVLYIYIYIYIRGVLQRGIPITAGLISKNKKKGDGKKK